MNLPIEPIPNTIPPRFRWRQTIYAHDGPKSITHEGAVPTSLEQALLLLIEVAKRQEQDIKGLQKQIEQHCDRIAAQSELLGKKAEAIKKPKG